MEELTLLKTSQAYYIVWFSAYWCGPCQRMDKAALETTAAEIGIPILYADCGVHEEIPAAYNISSFPTFVLFLGPMAVATRNTSDTFKVTQWMKALVK